MVSKKGYLTAADGGEKVVLREMAGQDGLGEIAPDTIAGPRLICGQYRKFRSFPILRAVCRNLRRAKDRAQEDFSTPSPPGIEPVFRIPMSRSSVSSDPAASRFGDRKVSCLPYLIAERRKARRAMCA